MLSELKSVSVMISVGLMFSVASPRREPVITTSSMSFSSLEISPRKNYFKNRGFDFLFLSSFRYILNSTI
ncbi:MAG: hypothetical protein CM15mP22_6050 [Gammaproteobacteria bacterium]|nr:MAG: hypothetical protein CM15mP22_6050 [Gammaproteobacteria bacterium]